MPGPAGCPHTYVLIQGFEGLGATPSLEKGQGPGFQGGPGHTLGRQVGMLRTAALEETSGLGLCLSSGHHNRQGGLH